MFFNDGSYFVGEIDFGLPSNGKYIWGNGDSWEGTMKNNSKHGYGVFTFNEGGTIEGEFIDNFPNGYCISTELDGRIYKGDCKMSANSIYNGQGQMIFPDGAIFKGRYEDGLPNGEGLYLTPEGVSLEGNFIKGQPKGDFLVTQVDGKTSIESF